MKRLAAVIGLCLSLAIMVAPALPLFAQSSADAGDPAIHFFYSPTCPHCHAEHDFLDGLEDRYPSVDINRYNVRNEEHHDLLRELAAETGAERYLGSVPLTFIGDTFVAGFDTPATTGAEIEQTVIDQYDLKRATSTPADNAGMSGAATTTVFGVAVDPAETSLPVLAILLGILDGFNVCSLGALILILGLVLTLGSRKKIALYGGAFVLTTAVIYGLLIVLWHQVFSLLAPYVVVMEALLAALGIGGGIYFLREWRRFRRQGVTCDADESPFVSRASKWVKRLFENRTSVLALLVAVIVFAVVLTVVEFPCSAAVPVMFAGILAKAELSMAAWIGYIALFVLFYLLDELIVFGIAVYKLHLWMASPKFTIWAALIEGVALLVIGLYYALSIIVAL